MGQLNIYLEAQSPLLLGSGLAVENVQSSRLYVAGSVWRGALARVLLQDIGIAGKSNESVDPTFKQIFLGDQAAHFGFLYPIRQHADELMPMTTTFVAPLTARTCKLESGFLSEGKGGVYDGVKNRLYEASKGLAPYTGKQGPGTCPHCDKRLKRMRGFVARYESNGQEKYETASLRRRSFVRVGLNRYTETAQESVLYVLDALVPGPGKVKKDKKGKKREEPITFVGVWHGNKEQLTTLKKLLDASLLPERQKGYTLRIGTARARGMGKVNLRFGDWQEQVGQQAELAKRLDQLQPREKGQLLDPKHLYASLTLRAPLQLLDKYGLPTTQVTLETLRAYNNNLPAGLQILRDYSIVEQETWTGWSAAWKLPKPVTIALAAGSVLLIRTPTSQREALLCWLTKLEQEGLGERRAEGWGEILLCDSFHITHDEKLSYRRK